jgi:alkanesulfonate monooxygenase SsuD/methylene tetrahydromethanopterin reductase-like flavin-dependent oxidoreductase (luciferase family)
VTLKLVAQYGDACNIGGEPDDIRHKLEVLRGHCEAVGRDYGTIIKSSNMLVFPLAPGADPEKATEKARAPWGSTLEQYRNTTLVGTVDEVATAVQAKVDAGIDYVIFYVPRVAYDLEPVQLLAEQLIPRFQ